MEYGELLTILYFAHTQTPNLPSANITDKDNGTKHNANVQSFWYNIGICSNNVSFKIVCLFYLLESRWLEENGSKQSVMFEWKKNRVDRKKLKRQKKPRTYNETHNLASLNVLNMAFQSARD